MVVFIDTNVFAFTLLEEKDARPALDVLDKIARGQIQAITSPLVLDELMWVLIKNNRVHLLEMATQNIYKLPNLQILNLDSTAPLIALNYIKEYNLKPRDAMHCAFMQINKIDQIITDDKDFDRVKQFKRIKI